MTTVRWASRSALGWDEDKTFPPIPMPAFCFLLSGFTAVLEFLECRVALFPALGIQVRVLAPEVV